MAAARVSLREELIFLLNEATELEHSLCCSYLFTALTLKSAPEDGLPAETVDTVRGWKRALTGIAVQEMFHLAVINDLLVAVGSAPNLDRPNFPHACSWFMPDLEIGLLPFNEETLSHFIAIEQPAGTNLPLRSNPALIGQVQGDLDNEIGPDPYALGSQGDVYDMVLEGLRTMSERLGEGNVFIGPEPTAALREFFGSNGWQPARTLDATRQLLHRVVSEGEGGSGDEPDSHFWRFTAVLEEYRALTASIPGFAPAFPVLMNPFARTPPEMSGPVNLIDDALAIQVSDLFNEVYTAMLQLLARAFVATEETEAEGSSLIDAAIEAMAGALIPLGELLVRLPAGLNHPGMTAGPSFVVRTLHALPSKKAAWFLLHERFEELRDYTKELASQNDRVGSLATIADSLSRIVDALSPAQPGGQAAEVRMAQGVERVYTTPEIEVDWSPSLCIHSGNCFRSLPGVFNPRARPWVNVQGASADEIARTVMICPSGALSYRWLDGRST